MSTVAALLCVDAHAVYTVATQTVFCCSKTWYKQLDVTVTALFVIFPTVVAYSRSLQACRRLSPAATGAFAVRTHTGQASGRSTQPWPGLSTDRLRPLSPSIPDLGRGFYRSPPVSIATGLGRPLAVRPRFRPSHSLSAARAGFSPSVPGFDRGLLSSVCVIGEPLDVHPRPLQACHCQPSAFAGALAPGVGKLVAVHLQL